ncbi:MAG: hypothetical protein K0S76_1721 [Herbinix sp.]|jgi:hypothetical protein|nr:hypothetical protein [Herbinix sp.]
MMDAIVVILILACLSFIMVYARKKRRSGQSMGCGGGCAHCSSSSSCHSLESKKTETK